MLCGKVAMEAILSIARASATRFKMQGAINLNRSLPFPTSPRLWTSAELTTCMLTGGYLAPQHYASLTERMAVPASSVKQWFNKERMAMGHQGDYHKYPSHPKRKGKPPAVEVSMKLPLSRGKAPSATHIPEVPSATHVPEQRSKGVVLQRGHPPNGRDGRHLAN